MSNPAFPFYIVHESDKETGSPVKSSFSPGMDLRDYFAAHCVIPLPDDIGVAFEKMGEEAVKEFLQALSAIRYAYADAMLAAREERQ